MKVNLLTLCNLCSSSFKDQLLGRGCVDALVEPLLIHNQLTAPHLACRPRCKAIRHQSKAPMPIIIIIITITYEQQQRAPQDQTTGGGRVDVRRNSLRWQQQPTEMPPVGTRGLRDPDLHG